MLERNCVRVLILMLLISGCGLVARADDLSAADVYKKSVASVMVLDVQNKDGSGVTGTGFMALKDGMAVTAYHVVRHAAKVTARFSDGQEFDVSGLIDSDPKRDIALIRVKVFGRPLLKLSTGMPDVGSKAYVIGAPLGLDFTVSDGLVSQIRLVSGVNLYQFSSPASPGNSGGPVFDATGDVIGVVSFQVTLGQNLNFAVPSTYVLAFDTTLPTTPWDQAKDGGPNLFTPDEPAADSASPANPASPASPSASAPDPAAASADNDHVDTGLAIALATYYDTAAWLDYEEYELRKNWEFRSGVPSAMYALLDVIKQDRAVLSAATSSDPLRLRLGVTLLSTMDHDMDALDDLTLAVRDAQTMGYWLGPSADLLSQCNAAFGTAPLPTDADVQSILTSSAFVNAAPLLATRLHDTEPFRLDMESPLSDSLFVCSVSRNGVADKIGLKPGDVIVSIAGVPVTSIYDFRDKVKANIGKKVTLVVIRDGKSKSYDSTVPAQ